MGVGAIVWRTIAFSPRSYGVWGLRSMVLGRGFVIQGIEETGGCFQAGNSSSCAKTLHSGGIVFLTTWGCRSHMINIVTIPDGQKYMLDVGFGNDGPTRPLPLSHGVVSQGILPQELRLVRENLAQNTDPDQMLWIYQRRYSPKDEWTSVYCFTELEFLPQDYEVMNFWTSQSRRSWFTYGIIVVKMIMENETLIGTLILDGEVVKRRIRGSTEKWICKTEDERVEALKTWFKIELTQDERAGIRGLVTEL
jgi:arylamine N-acetyltransferase